MARLSLNENEQCFIELMFYAVTHTLCSCGYLLIRDQEDKKDKEMELALWRNGGTRFELWTALACMAVRLRWSGVEIWAPADWM